MSDYRISLTKRARDDIIEIGDYITFTLLEPDTSRNFIDGLRNSISQLRFFPYKFPLVRESIIHSQGIRCMPYKNYYFFYKIMDNMKVVIILRIGYNKRDWKSILA